MANKKTIELQNVKNPFEKKIITFLDKNGKCIYGEIFRELKIPTAKGQEAMYSLISKGLVQHVDKTSFVELTANIK